MSAGYAARLKEYPHKGVCGLPEAFETSRSLLLKVRQLAAWIQHSKRVVIVTGAGISTAAGIPDFRGPKGIWTVEQQKKKRKRNNAEQDTAASPSMDFARVQPTLTHRAITYLVSKGMVRYVVTQNVDGLHRRSGLSRDAHCCLHGCVFTEVCTGCKAEHFRDFDVGGMSFQKTGRRCDLCGCDLIDTLLDWEDPLPEDDFERATEECEKADLALALGTSLRIEPAGSLPTLAKKYAIVNLQETPKDEGCSLILRGRADEVVALLMEELGLQGWERETVPLTQLTWVPPPTTETTAEAELDANC